MLPRPGTAGQMYAGSTTFLRRNLQYLAGLDLVGVGQDVAIGFENLRVLAGVAEMLLGDAAQRVAGLDGVGPARRRARGLSARASPGAGRRRGLGHNLDVGLYLARIVRHRFQRVPDLVLLVLGLHRAAEVQLSV